MENGTREVTLTPLVAQLLAGEVQNATAAAGRFEAALRMALAHSGDPAGQFVGMNFKADGSATVVVTTRATDTLTER